jgi:CheY-like chemotaxis protein
MPEMDGYALARAVRDQEAAEDRARTPIIAWTANVKPDALAQCRAAGIDDMLIKPAELETLEAIMSKWLTSGRVSSGPGTDPDTAAGDRQAVVMDPHALDRIAFGAADKAEIMHDFMFQVRRDLADLEAAFESANLPACQRFAHRMRGASQMVGARDMAMARAIMEAAAQRGAQDDAGMAKEAVVEAVARLTTHLAVPHTQETECLDR